MERTMELYMEVSDAAESELQEFVLVHLKNIRYGFMQIGFVLWQLKNFNFTKDIVRYAREHFGFSRTSTYRFINLCEAYSQRDNNGVPTGVLEEKYAYYNASQLAEMLSLSAEQKETVTPDMSVAKIREMRARSKNPIIEGADEILKKEKSEDSLQHDETVTVKESADVGIQKLEKHPDEKEAAWTQRDALQEDAVVGQKETGADQDLEDALNGGMINYQNAFDFETDNYGKVIRSRKLSYVRTIKLIDTPAQYVQGAKQIYDLLGDKKSPYTIRLCLYERVS